MWCVVVLQRCSAVDVEQFQLVADRIQNGMEQANSESCSLPSPSSSVMRSFPSKVAAFGN
jgi:hypothetical protein